MSNTFFNDSETEQWDKIMKELDKAFWKAFYKRYPEDRDLVKPEWME